MSIFKFKQFEVNQSGCAMKINTDGVLIGAAANHPSPKNILDIGTGTGVIAMMMAQRFPNAIIDAVEIDEQAAETAKRNFQLSVFSDRLAIKNIAIQQYHNTQKFDLIVSNPPFFVNDLKSEELKKGIARHADEDFFQLLVKKSSEFLSDGGKIWLILPVKQANKVIEIASLYGLSLFERIHIHSDETKPTFRQMICLGREEVIPVERDFYIYESFKKHSAIYKELLKDFFLAF
ncbi:methyltransferase domain-containing protein [Pedobacter frigidisoli]|uniref:tRNA1(Val) (adenine(37)-N6)-methyltransferase n=1 Tax=Pedobacter frigidisoli TaxID=2530455 RepID=A0A4R0NVQ0_9SPHI|nr:methyltransferase [Pedobacter frigidisoli]TCD05581.1 methyltransferase domain-containing protein [Pedobacter frigidisoli]